MKAFDHLVIGAPDLAAGAAWARATLGVEIGPGGAHAEMGTHNRLGRLGAGYLEVIAVDPSAAAQAQPRWYGLDDAATQAAIRERPRPIAWVLAVRDLDAAVAAAPWDAGSIRSASRGDLTWRIAFPEGGLPAEGVFPALIEWPEALHRRAPVDRMTPLGLSLRRLTLRHAAPRDAQSRLDAYGAAKALSAAGVELSLMPLDARSWPIEAVFTAAAIDRRL